MKYRSKRHITNTLLYAVFITALGAVILRYSKLDAVVFLLISTIALVFDRCVESKHLKEAEG